MSAKELAKNRIMLVPKHEIFFTAFALWSWFLVFEYFIRSNDMYRTLPIVDVPSHFFSGLTLGVGFFWILSLITRKRSKVLLAVMLTFITAIFWEIAETVEEVFVYNPPHLRDIFLWDGISDILITTLGAVVSTFLLIYWPVIRLPVSQKSRAKVKAGHTARG